MDRKRPATVAVCVVTYNDAEDLADFFAAVARLDYRPLEMVLVDCASQDASAETARAAWPEGLPGQVIELRENLGFAGGMNRAIGASQADLVLTLNADTRPQEDFVTHLVAALELDVTKPSRAPRCGSATGRLVRFPEADEDRRLDACGMRLTTNWRHLDRASGELDLGQFGRPAWVFGGTGAATLFRRDALDDVALDDDLFATEFHSFREDAELAFRLQERGWGCRYEPQAVAYHRRSNLPERRHQMPDYVNYHSLKNRYLLRAYHQTLGNFVKTLAPTLVRDLGALLYVLLREHSSLASYRWLWQQRHEILARRRHLRRRQTVANSIVDRWFFHDEEPA